MSEIVTPMSDEKRGAPKHRRNRRVSLERPKGWVVALRVFLVAHAVSAIVYGVLGLLWLIALAFTAVGPGDRPDWPVLDLADWHVLSWWVLITGALMLVVAGFRGWLRLDRPKLVLREEDDEDPSAPG